MGYYKTLSSNIKDENPYWRYKHDKYKLVNGKEADYYYVETNGNSMVVPVLDDGRLVLVMQHRYLSGKLSVEFPCGGIFKNETPLECVSRELLEETGFRAKEIMKVSSFEPLNGLARDTTHLFVGYGIAQEQEPALDETEDVEVVIRRIDEFEEMIRRGEVWDGQTLASWAIASEYVKKYLS